MEYSYFELREKPESRDMAKECIGVWGNAD